MRSVSSIAECIAARRWASPPRSRSDTSSSALSTASVRADPGRVQQAVGNLIDNTLRYGAGTITLGARPAGDRVEIHVADEGAGFSDWLLPRAFDRFSRADPARQRGGVGLGLAVVQMIAQAHGGRAGARNLPAGGADVWLSLPVSRNRSSASPPALPA